MKEKEIYELLAAQGVRIFVLKLSSDRTTYIHPQKTTKEWRSDLKRFKSELNIQNDEEGYSDDDVYNELTGKLSDAGYIDVDDVASDIYEGRVAVYSAGIEDDPSHEEQEDGFGHYGWESKNEYNQIVIESNRKSRFNVHMPVQNTDNLNRIGKSLTVKDYMAASIQFPVANSNLTAILPFKRVGSQLLKRNVQHL
jgi:hypothetical protein